jgi:prolycopene isomerase
VIQPDFDVIVIGTGMGGSAAGAISALNGLRTLILEKNPRPGGACSYYERDGFRMDCGTHLFIRGNKGPFGQLTRRLGMGTPIDFRHTDYTVQLKGLNVDITVPKGQLGQMAVLPMLAWQSRISPLQYPGIARLVHDILLKKPHEIDALNSITVEEYMLRFTHNEEVRAMFGLLLGLFFILPPWEASAGESIWNLQKLIKEANLGYPKGGAVAIPQTFLQGAQQHGAQLRLKSPVRKINVENGEVHSVTLRNGQTITTKCVISTTSVQDTIDKLVGKSLFPAAYLERMKTIKPSWTAVQAKIALDKKLVRAGSLVGGTPLKLDRKFSDQFLRDSIGSLEEGRFSGLVPIYAPVPSNYDPELAPPGCQIITAVAVAPTLDIKLQDGDQVWIDGMMDSLRQLIPNLQKHILFCDTWSVKTLAKWIGKSNGSAITTSQTPAQVGLNRPSHRTPVKGLYLAGDCAGHARGVGTELACQSGMDCADMVTSDLRNYVLGDYPLVSGNKQAALSH